MTLDPGLAGRTFGPSTAYTVSREKIREFERAIGVPAGGGGATAPLTFPIIVAFEVLELLLNDPDVGLELRNVVHAAQRFDQVRPLRAGDEVQATLTVDSVRSAAGADLLATTTQVTTTHGELLCTAVASLVHRSSTP